MCLSLKLNGSKSRSLTGKNSRLKLYFTRFLQRKWSQEVYDATGRCTSAPQDIKGAKQFGFLAPVMPFRENHVVFEDEPYIVDETRLALNVYVPKTKNLAKKPVMVWIHGGHMQFGCGEQEDPTVLGNKIFIKRKSVQIFLDFFRQFDRKLNPDKKI